MHAVVKYVVAEKLDDVFSRPTPCMILTCIGTGKKSKCSPYSISERSVPELISVLGSQPAGDVSHKPGGRLPLLSASCHHNP